MVTKKNRVAKTGAVWHRSSEQATLDHMPKYNGYACKTGAHGDVKYNRAKQKRAWQREIFKAEARNRGPLPIMACFEVHAMWLVGQSYQVAWSRS